MQTTKVNYILFNLFDVDSRVVWEITFILNLKACSKYVFIYLVNKLMASRYKNTIKHIKWICLHHERRYFHQWLASWKQYQVVALIHEHHNNFASWSCQASLQLQGKSRFWRSIWFKEIHWAGKVIKNLQIFLCFLSFSVVLCSTIYTEHILETTQWKA